MSIRDEGGRGITRRDYLNGMLMAAGGLGVSSFFPARAFALGEAGCDATISVNSDPRARRAGDVREAFSIGHWLRDHRLTFSETDVVLAPTPRDPTEGRFDIATDAGQYDVIVVGSGLSGLSTAFWLRQRRPGTRILMLDGGGSVGGVASRDEASPPLPVAASAGGAYAVMPYEPFLTDFYETIGLDWTEYQIPAPLYSYFFDSACPYSLPGAYGWTSDVYADGLSSMPYPQEVIRDLLQARQTFRNWYNRAGSPTDPADHSDPRYDYLAQMTLDHYLTVECGFHPAVSDFYTRYAVDALCGRAEDVAAYTAISFLGAEYNPCWAPPGGTSGIARHALKHLIPAAFDSRRSRDILSDPVRTEALDVAGEPVRIRQRAMAVRADTDSTGASVVYYHNGTFYRARAGAVVLAGQAHTARHLVAHLVDEARQVAFDALVLGPVAVANVALHRAAPLVELGLGYNQYYWGSSYWADFTIADWTTGRVGDRDRPTVLTFYGANMFAPSEMAAERGKLLTTPFCDYEESLREDLNRVLAPAGFEFDRDVSHVYLYRWGHGMIFPAPGVAHGVPVQVGGRDLRTPAPRHDARAAIGRISFAGQDTESSPAVESALWSGQRAADEVLEHI